MINEYKPMLLSGRLLPFSHPDYIFEIKFDGVRCIARLNDKTVLTGRSGKDFTPLFPELLNIHTCCGKNCVLDGEIVVFKGSTQDFSACLSRTAGAKLRAKSVSGINPAVFIAFDILELNGKNLTNLPLLQRKKLLKQNVSENKKSLIVCPFVKADGDALFEFVKQNSLEGMVAKRADSLYHSGKRTADWLKIKVVKQEEFVVFGYTLEENSDTPRDLILGDFSDGKAVFKTKIYIGNKQSEIERIKKFALKNTVFTPIFKDFAAAVWLKPQFFCRIEYLEKTKGGNFRQPVFKSLYCFKD